MIISKVIFNSTLGPEDICQEKIESWISKGYGCQSYAQAPC